MFSMDFVYSSLLEGSTSTVAVVVISCVIVALPITYGIQKLLKKYLICFVGAMVGVLLTMGILQPMSPPAWLRYLAYAANGVIGFIIFKEAKHFMTRAATALIGAMLFLIGLSMAVAGDTTSNLQFQKGVYMQPRFWGYTIGFLVLTALGTWIQIKYMPEPDLGDDEDKKTSSQREALLSDVEKDNTINFL